jgi:uncharacterized Zn finger protein
MMVCELHTRGYITKRATLRDCLWYRQLKTIAQSQCNDFEFIEARRVMNACPSCIHNSVMLGRWVSR